MLQLAQQVINDDEQINQLRYAIEEHCLELIATQQPAASDLRMTIAATHIAVELERMADHAGGTAEIVKRMYDEPLLKPLIDLPIMAQIAKEMIHTALDAFVVVTRTRRKRWPPATMRWTRFTSRYFENC